MINKQQFNKCVNILNAGGALITHRGYYAVQDNTHDTLINISEELFSAVIEYCGGRENFTVTDTATQFGTESTWELIIPIYNNTLPAFARTDINSKLTKTPEFKQKVDSVKQAVKNAFGCTPYERKNNAKYTLLKFWAKSIVPIGELEKIEKMFSDVSTERITSFEFNVIVYPDSNMVVEGTSDLMEALNRAHKLDEGTISVRVPAAIRDYVDAYCDAINDLSSYNPDKWDRGTGIEFFDSGKYSSAYADRVMYGVMDNYELNDDQLDAVYKYVEFQEDAEWYDDSSVTNVFDASCLQDDDDDDEDEYDDDFEEGLLGTAIQAAKNLNPLNLFEGEGADTTRAIVDILDKTSTEDKPTWVKAVKDVVDVIPDEYMDNLFDIAKEKLSDVQVSEEDKAKIVDAAGVPIEGAQEANTVGKILSLFDITTWDAKTLKTYIVAVLGIVALIEPTPILEIITAIITLLPADAVKAILSVTNMIGNPVGAAATLANKAYRSAKDKHEGLFDKPKKNRHTDENGNPVLTKLDPPPEGFFDDEAPKLYKAEPAKHKRRHNIFGNRKNPAPAGDPLDDLFDDEF